MSLCVKSSFVSRVEKIPNFLGENTALKPIVQNISHQQVRIPPPVAQRS